VNENENDWILNYFNYFTEIEEHFQRTRGTGLFLLSPLDWALIETWKNAGVPLEAVFRGIDEAFAKWRSRKSRVRMVNSLAFCTQAVLTQAQRMAGTAPVPREGRDRPAPFDPSELCSYLTENAEGLRQTGHATYIEIASSLDRLADEIDQYATDLEKLEQRLTALEDKMIATARSEQTGQQLLAARRDLESQLRPYRGKMTAEQLVMIEKQYLERRVLEDLKLPRLSLFYLR